MSKFDKCIKLLLVYEDGFSISVSASNLAKDIEWVAGILPFLTRVGALICLVLLMTGAF